MKDKQILRAAVLHFANETAKNLSLINYLLENVTILKPYTNLFENASDAEVFQEIFGFGKSKPLSVLTPDEKAVLKVFKDKLDIGMKQLPALTKVTVDDPTRLGLSLEKMVELVKDVYEVAKHAEEMYGSMDQSAQEELGPKMAELMKAKMAFLGMVAFKLTELRKEATAAVQKLTSIVPAGELKFATNSASSGYKPSLPMRSALDVLTSRDLPAATAEPMGMPGAMRLREEEEAKETPWQEAEPEGK